MSSDSSERCLHVRRESSLDRMVVHSIVLLRFEATSTHSTRRTHRTDATIQNGRSRTAFAALHRSLPTAHDFGVVLVPWFENVLGITHIRARRSITKWNPTALWPRILELVRVVNVVMPDHAFCSP